MSNPLLVISACYWVPRSTLFVIFPMENSNLYSNRALIWNVVLCFHCCIPACVCCCVYTCPCFCFCCCICVCSCDVLVVRLRLFLLLFLMIRLRLLLRLFFCFGCSFAPVPSFVFDDTFALAPAFVFVDTFALAPAYFCSYAQACSCVCFCWYDYVHSCVCFGCSFALVPVLFLLLRLRFPSFLFFCVFACPCVCFCCCVCVRAWVFVYVYYNEMLLRCCFFKCSPSLLQAIPFSMVAQLWLHHYGACCGEGIFLGFRESIRINISIQLWITASAYALEYIVFCHEWSHFGFTSINIFMFNFLVS